MHSRRGALAPAVVVVALAACARSDDAPPRIATADAGAARAPAGVLPITARDGALAAPDTISAGWTRLRVMEDGAGHIVVLFRVPDGDLAAFAAALDGGNATPPGAVALGGPEVGDSGEVIVDLPAGRYVLGCLRRGKDGHRHAARGELRELVVAADARPASPATAPAVTDDLRMTDFAYVGPDTWAPGARVVAVRNDGRQDHQLRLARLREGATIADWIAAGDGDDVARDVAGVARLGAGQVAYLPVDLPAGEYVAYCLVPDPASGRPHVMLGMMRAIHVAGGRAAR